MPQGFPLDIVVERPEEFAPGLDPELLAMAQTTAEPELVEADYPGKKCAAAGGRPRGRPPAVGAPRSGRPTRAGASRGGSSSSPRPHRKVREEQLEAIGQRPAGSGGPGHQQLT